MMLNDSGKPTVPRRMVWALLACLGIVGALCLRKGHPAPRGDSAVRSDAVRRSLEAHVSASTNKSFATSPSETAAPANDVQFATCLALASDGREEAVRKLINTILNETDEASRYKLVQSLQAVTNPAVCGVLYDALTNTQVTGSLLLALVDAVPRLATPELVRRMVEYCRNAALDDCRRDWLLQVIAEARGSGVPAACATLLDLETNLTIQTALAAVLIHDGSAASLDALVDKIERSGTTNRNDPLVVMLTGVSQGESLFWLVDEFDSTTNPVIKWAIGSAITRIRHLNQHTQ